MGVISDIQGGQALLSSTNSTLSWDGTSLKGIHLNEIHISTEKENVVLGVSNLPGGRQKIIPKKFCRQLATSWRIIQVSKRLMKKR